MENTKIAMSYGVAYQAISSMYEKIDALSAEREKALEPYPTYPKGFIFDEDKSVRWNREEVQRRAASRERILQDYRNKEQVLLNTAVATIKEFIVQEFGLSHEIADEVYAMANERGHSAGFYEILNDANSYGELVQKVLRIHEKESKK